MRIERTEQLIYSWVDKSSDNNQGQSALGNKANQSTDYQKLSGDNKSKNVTSVNNDMESRDSSTTNRTYPEAKVETNKRAAMINDDQKRLLGMFFSFCEP